MKLLYLVNEPELITHRHIITYLTDRGVEVTIEVLSPNHELDGVADFSKFVSGGFRDFHYNKGYDFLVTGIHFHHFVAEFLRFLAPTLKVIEIDHDLFDGVPLSNYQVFNNKKNCIAIAFTKIQNELAEKYLSDIRQIINCKWYKLDAEYKKIETPEIDKWDDIILIGTMVFGTKERREIKELDLFNGVARKIWYKKIYPHWENPFKTEPLPDIFTGPKGVKYCCDACKFIVSRCSSCIVESILFGSIPIVLPEMICFEKEENEIVSSISLTYSLSNPEGPSLFTEKPVKVVTTKNIEKKIKMLRSSKSLYNDVHKELFSFWFGDDYYSLPTLGEVIYDQIEKHTQY